MTKDQPTCKTCRGKKEVRFEGVWNECPHCGGTGVQQEGCELCGGKGSYADSRSNIVPCPGCTGKQPEAFNPPKTDPSMLMQWWKMKDMKPQPEDLHPNKDMFQGAGKDKVEVLPLPEALPNPTTTGAVPTPAATPDSPLREQLTEIVAKHEAVMVVNQDGSRTLIQEKDGGTLLDQIEALVRKERDDERQKCLEWAAQLPEVKAVESRMIELDLLEQAINQGRDMNEYKLMRLAELESHSG